MRRNKVDALDKHPWKAEITEGDANVSASTISGWYEEVYEPVFSNNAAQPSAPEGEPEGEVNPDE